MIKVYGDCPSCGNPIFNGESSCRICRAPTPQDCQGMAEEIDIKDTLIGIFGFIAVVAIIWVLYILFH
jgi:hypothetical protein